MSGWAQKRFWSTVSVVPEAGGYSIRLDGRPVMTPAKAPLLAPTEVLGHAIAAEWDAQTGKIRPETMPVTRSANAAIDKVAPNIKGVVDEIAGFGATDLLCYRAVAPQTLIARQAAAWDPLLDWARTALGVRLVVTVGVVPVAQPAESLAVLESQVRAMSPFALTALHDLVALSGSLIIGLRAVHGGADINALWALSRVDEDWQIEMWGADEEASATSSEKHLAFLHASAFYRLGAEA